MLWNELSLLVETVITPLYIQCVIWPHSSQVLPVLLAGRSWGRPENDEAMYYP